MAEKGKQRWNERKETLKASVCIFFVLNKLRENNIILRILNKQKQVTNQENDMMRS